METTLRIKTIVNEIQYTKLGDIGTDHGYIPILAIKNKIVKTAIACDINKEPLQCAKNNVIKYNLSNCIKCRCGNGLKPLEVNEVETITIAGMGGMLITEILQNDTQVVNNIKQLVLQPQMGIYNLRKYIHTINFKITNEVIIQEGGRFYNIINCHKGEEEPYTEKEYRIGKIILNEKQPILKMYLLEEIKKTKNVYKNVKLGKDEEKLKKLKKLIDMYEEVCNCL
jgi:tRNA (adenine22-N1)-methyltransferase